ncbi:MAG: hypothetical protein Q8922_09815 [Bacteroidota bacterium]|nr:hypothetical protein [Bacteroidota bacterium]MDP4232851.1 hypothetical protein [Bacteroidota bacterium]MDP4241895.1 hypothetical protein [Bacteroidota bacterium]MDP4288220.1 hypothetical protein [Bacteroidota bacterium]
MAIFLFLAISGCKSHQSAIPPPHYGSHTMSLDSVDRARIYLRRANHVSLELVRMIQFNPAGEPTDTFKCEFRYALLSGDTLTQVRTMWFVDGPSRDTTVYDPFDRVARLADHNGGIQAYQYDDANHTVAWTAIAGTLDSSHKEPSGIRTALYRFDPSGHQMSWESRVNGHRAASTVCSFDNHGRPSCTVAIKYHVIGDSGNCCDSSPRTKKVLVSAFDGAGRIRTDSESVWKDGVQGPTLPASISDPQHHVDEDFGKDGKPHYRYRYDNYGRISVYEDIGRLKNITTYSANGLEKEIVATIDGKDKPSSVDEYAYEYDLHAK